MSSVRYCATLLTLVCALRALPAHAGDDVALTQLRKALDAADMSSASAAASLSPHVARLEAEDAAQQKQFAAAGARTLPPKAAERLRQARQAYAEGRGRLLTLLRNVVSSDASDIARVDSAREAAILVRALQAVGAGEPISDSVLSVGGPDPSAPALGAVLGGASEPIGIIPEAVQQFADSLAGPVEVYENVRNGIRPDFYYGAMRGAEEVLREGSGNDADTATLLVLMLRAKGVPARYVRGTVQISAASLIAVTGTANATQAIRVLARAGIPHEAVLGAGGLAAVKVERIWVEAYVPYSNYRGAALDAQGKTWIPLDPGFKRLQTPQGIDVVRVLGFDARPILDGYADVLRPETPLDFVRQQVTSLLAASRPDLTYAGILNHREPLGETYGILPSTLPYKVEGVTETSYELPVPLRHSVHVSGDDGSVIDAVFDVPDVLGQRLTLSYEPFSDDDADVARSYGGLANTPPYLVEVRAVVKVGGVPIAKGQSPIGLGVRYTLKIQLITPGGVQGIENRVVAGALTAIGLGGRVATGAETGSEKAAQILAQQARRYLEGWNASDDELAALLRVVPVRPSVSLCLVASVVDVQYAGGDPLYPLTFTWKGVSIDADRRSSAPVGIESTDNERPFLLLSGLQGSTLEDRVFQDPAGLGVESVSTNKVLALAKGHGQTLYDVDAATVDAILPLLPFDPQVLAEIEDAARRGRVVRVPAGLVTHRAWTGVGYRVLDESTGQAAYQLQGGYSGGVTAVSAIEIPAALRDPLIQQDETPDLAPQDRLVALIDPFRSADFQMGTVKMALPKPLKVVVRNKEGIPVPGANVFFTATGGGEFVDPATGRPAGGSIMLRSDDRGLASVSLVLGSSTREIPRFITLDGDEFATQVGLNLVDVSVGTVSLRQPLTAFAFPDYRLETGQAHEPVNWLVRIGLIGTSSTNGAGTNLYVSDRLGASVTDQYGNPISNKPIRFAYLSHDLEEPAAGWVRMRDRTDTPGKVLRPDDFDRCFAQGGGSLVYGRCAGEAVEVVVKSNRFGAFAYPILGDSPYSRYTFTIGTVLTPRIVDVGYSTWGIICNAPSRAACAAAAQPWVHVDLMYGGGHSLFPRHVEDTTALESTPLVVWEEEEVLPSEESGATVYRVRGTNRWHVDPLGGMVATLTPETEGTRVLPAQMEEYDEGVYRTTLTASRTPLFNIVRFDVQASPPEIPYIRNGGALTDKVDPTAIRTDPETGHLVVERRIDPLRRRTSSWRFGFWGIEPKIVNVDPPGPIRLDVNRRVEQAATVTVDVLPSEYRDRIWPEDVAFQLKAGGTSVVTAHGLDTVTIPKGMPLVEGRYQGELTVVTPDAVSARPSKPIDACFVLGLDTPVVALSVTRDPNAHPLGSGSGCANDGTLRFNLCRPSRVTLELNGSVLTAPLDGESSSTRMDSVLLSAGPHRLTMDAATDLPALGEAPFHVIAVDGADPTLTQTADGIVRRDVCNRPILPIGRTFVKGVDLFDGHLVQQVSDFKVRGRHLGLEIARSYSSAGRGSTGEMGENWSWTYASQVTPSSCGLVNVSTIDGGVTFSTVDGQTFTPQDGSHSRLVRDAASGGYRFLDKAGNAHYFQEKTDPGRANSPYRLNYIEEPHGDRLVMKYTGAGKVESVAEVHPDGGEVRRLDVHYETFGLYERIQKITSPALGLELVYDYDTQGNLVEARRKGTNVQGPSSTDDRVYHYKYTAENPEDRHQMTEAIDPNGHSVKYAYYGKDDVFPVPDPSVVISNRDEYVREVKELPGGGQPDVVTKFQYDFTDMGSEHYKTTVTDGRENDTLYVMNVHGSPLEVHEPLGKTTHMEWDLVEKVKTKEIDALGRETRYQHSNGNLTEERILAKGLGADPEAVTEVVTQYAYDPQFNKLQYKKDAEGRETIYTIGTRGDLEKVRDPEGNETAYHYDEHGQMTDSVDPRGHLTGYPQYDVYGFGLPTRSNDPMGISRTQSYDARGREIGEYDSLGHSKSVLYDAFDRLVRVDRRAGIDSAGALLESEVTETQYYPNGESRSVARQIEAKRRTTTTFALDGMNRVTTATTDVGYGGEQFDVTTTYDGNGNKVEERDGRGVRRKLTYDALNRLKTVEILSGPAAGPTGPIATFQYDAAGNKTEETDITGRTTRYDYDSLYRVKVKHLPEGAYQEAYGYDLVGNRTLFTDANGHAAETHYDGLNRVIETKNALSQRTTVTYLDPEGHSKVTKAEENDLTRGVKTTYLYDLDNRELRRTVTLYGPGGAGEGPYVTQTSYVDKGHAYEVTDPNRGVTRYELDGLDHVARKVVQEAGGLVTLARYDGLGGVKEVRDPRGYSTLFVSDGLGRVRQTIDARRRSSFATFDAAVKTRETDRRGLQKDFTYDNLGRLTKTFVAGTRTGVDWKHEVEYRDVQHQRIETDARDHRTTYDIDGLGRTTKVTDALEHFAEMHYDGVNKLEEIDKRGNKTTFQYDAINRLRTTVDPAPFQAQTVVTTYDDVQNTRTVKDKKGHQTVSQMDPLGRVRTVTRAGVLLERNEYDGNGNKILAVDGEGRQTKFEYDKANRLLARIDGFGSPEAAVTSFHYDPNGNVDKERDGRAALLNAAFSTAKTYDELNRLTTVTDGELHVTTYAYDEEGNRIGVTEPMGQVTSFVYDELGKLTKVTQPAVNGVQPETRYTYDGNRNRTKQTDANSHDVTMTYDALDRLETMTQDPDGLGLVTTHHYDENGNEDVLTDPKGQKVTSSFDALNRLHSKAYVFAAGDPTRPWRHTTGMVYTYDPNNNLTQVDEDVASGTDPPATRTTTRSYDAFDRLESETAPLPDGAGNRTVSNTYYRNGTRGTVSASLPTGVPGSGTTTYTYDGRNRLQTVTTSDGKLTKYTYYPDSLLDTVAYPNGAVAKHTYDKADRLVTLANTKASTVLSSYAYGYDANGNRLTQTEVNGGLTEATSYTYDPLNRLATITYPDKKLEYGYDAAGNREREVTKDLAGAITDSKTGHFDHVNRLTELTDDLDATKTIAFGYDADGNQISKTVGGTTTTFIYDIRDEQVEARTTGGAVAQFQYDFDRRMIRGDEGEGIRGYVYDQTSRLLEYGPTGIPFARYDYGDRLLRLTNVYDGGEKYYHYDALGSVTTLTDAIGSGVASFHLDAWGIFRNPAELNATKNRAAFTGYFFNPLLNLYYAKARFYDPETARFTTEDSYLGKIDDPPSLHRYFYANDNPTRYIDVTGHSGINATAYAHMVDQMSPEERAAYESRQEVAAGIVVGAGKLVWGIGKGVFDLAYNVEGAFAWGATAGAYGEGSQEAATYQPQMQAVSDAVMFVPQLLSRTAPKDTPQALLAKTTKGLDRSAAAFDRGDVYGATSEFTEWAGGLYLLAEGASSPPNFTISPGTQMEYAGGGTVRAGSGTVALTGGQGGIPFGTFLASKTNDAGTVKESADREKAAARPGSAADAHAKPAFDSASGTQRWKDKVTKDGRPYNKPGPKTDPNAPHNRKVNEIIAEEKAKGREHVGGGTGPGGLTEISVETPGGNKPYRRMDASFRDPQTGEVVHHNVGLENKRGDAIKRERDAIEDVTTKADPADRNLTFHGYDPEP
jgi:RHS repeat-associated protein